MFDLLTKAVDFTNIEIRCLVAWGFLLLNGDFEQAGRVLATGLLYEHYRSELPPDPANYTLEEAAILGKLAEAFEDSLKMSLSIGKYSTVQMMQDYVAGVYAIASSVTDEPPQTEGSDAPS